MYRLIESQPSIKIIYITIVIKYAKFYNLD